MDLNYLFYRQQVERSRAEAAQSELVRSVHAKLATEYEKRIARAAEGSSELQSRVDVTGPVTASDVNATMAVAITAREVAGSK
jgi:hypothetical protein